MTVILHWIPTFTTSLPSWVSLTANEWTVFCAEMNMLLLIKSGPIYKKTASWSRFSCPQLLPNVQGVLIEKRRKWVRGKIQWGLWSWDYGKQKLSDRQWYLKWKCACLSLYHTVHRWGSTHMLNSWIMTDFRIEVEKERINCSQKLEKLCIRWKR